MFELPEKTIAHYTIRRRLAHGGMSDVFLAYDEKKQCDVAIKVVNRSDEDYFIRFQRELQVLSTLIHPHILPIFEDGEHGPWHYCIMPYIEHGTLRERLLKKSFTLEEAGEMLEQIASALQFAHEHGILHRDIKPSNILLKDENCSYLADFGLAKDMRSSSSLTQMGCLIGTPEYMAPELAETTATPGSDIYALGILLYQMLTGTVPFKGATPMSTYLKHINEQPLPPSLLNPAISYPIEQVVLRAIAKDPQHRFETALAMAQAYTQALANVDPLRGQPTEADRGIKLATPTQRIIKLPATHRSPRVSTGIVVLVAAICGFVLPFTLGFWSLNSAAPISAMGASIQFTSVTSTQPSPTRSSTQQHTSHPFHPSSAKQGNGSLSGGQGGGQSYGHGHKHKHGHRHAD